MHQSMTLLYLIIAIGIVIEENVTVAILLTIHDNKKIVSYIVSIVLYCYVLSDIVKSIVRPGTGLQIMWLPSARIDSDSGGRCQWGG